MGASINIYTETTINQTVSLEFRRQIERKSVMNKVVNMGLRPFSEDVVLDSPRTVDTSTILAIRRALTDGERTVHCIFQVSYMDPFKLRRHLPADYESVVARRLRLENILYIMGFDPIKMTDRTKIEWYQAVWPTHVEILEHVFMLNFGYTANQIPSDEREVVTESKVAEAIKISQSNQELELNA